MTIKEQKNTVEEYGFSQPFLEYMLRESVLNQQTKTLIAQNCRLVEFQKGDRLLEMGTECKYVYFIVKGECISYFTNCKGKTTTWFFHFNMPHASIKNIFAVDYKSFLSGEPAALSIEALSQVTTIRFSRREMDLLIKRSRIFERWIRKLNENAFVITYDRINTLLNMSAPERYKKFLKDEPYLLNMFSNYHIATYLDVAPQSLSRIRRNVI